MKTLLDCDRVFDILTRAPFPTGTGDDQAVERHLAACHDCRRLAEALRPAVDLFHEALAEHEAATLPCYSGNAAQAPSSLPTSLDEMLRADANQHPVLKPASVPHAAAHAPSNGFSGVGLVGGLLAACLVGVCLSLTIQFTASRLVANGFGDSENHRFTEARRLERRVMLASLSIPGECRPTGPVADSGDASSMQDFVCCTRCHMSSKRSPAPSSAEQPATDRAVALVVRSCSACHDG